MPTPHEDTKNILNEMHEAIPDMSWYRKIKASQRSSTPTKSNSSISTNDPRDLFRKSLGDRGVLDTAATTFALDIGGNIGIPNTDAELMLMMSDYGINLKVDVVRALINKYFSP